LPIDEIGEDAWRDGQKFVAAAASAGRADRSRPSLSNVSVSSQRGCRHATKNKIGLHI
jgi:hypothetical protein